MGFDEEPLFTVGEEETVETDTEIRHRWPALAIALAVVAAAVAFAPLLAPDEPDSTDDSQPLVVEPVEGAWPAVVAGWSWMPADDVPPSEVAFWAGTGVAVVDEAWSADARWSFTADGETWTEPTTLAYNPIAATTGTVERPWQPGVIGVRAGGTWELVQAQGLPPDVLVGWQAHHAGTFVVASTAPWATIDWARVAGDEVEPSLAIDGAEVVVSKPSGWGTELRVSAVHDPDSSQVRLEDGDGAVRLAIGGFGEAPPDLRSPGRWMHHGLLPQQLFVGATGSAELRHVAAPWLGEAAIASDDAGFVAVSVGPSGQSLELWRSVTGTTWDRVEEVLVTASPIRDLEVVAGGDSVVIEYCAGACDRVVVRDGLWWEADSSRPLPQWNGATWWSTDGTTVELSADAIGWQEVAVPDLAAWGVDEARVFVLGREQIVLAGGGGDGSVQIVVGEPDPVG